MVRPSAAIHGLASAMYQTDPALLAIDGGYWLLVLVLSGAVIGAIGV